MQTLVVVNPITTIDLPKGRFCFLNEEDISYKLKMQWAIYGNRELTPPEVSNP